MFSSIKKKRLVAAAKFLVAATKNLFVVLNIVDVTKHFFPCYLTVDSIIILSSRAILHKANMLRLSPLLLEFRAIEMYSEVWQHCAGDTNVFAHAFLRQAIGQKDAPTHFHIEERSQKIQKLSKE